MNYFHKYGKWVLPALLLVLILLTPFGFAHLKDRTRQAPTALSCAEIQLLPELGTEDYSFWKAIHAKEKRKYLLCDEVPAQADVYDALLSQLDTLMAGFAIPQMNCENPQELSMRLMRYICEDPAQPDLALWAITAVFEDRQMAAYMDAKSHTILELHIVYSMPPSSEQLLNPDNFMWYLKRCADIPKEDPRIYEPYTIRSIGEISLMFYSVEPDTGKNVFYMFTLDDIYGVGPDGEIMIRP